MNSAQVHNTPPVALTIAGSDSGGGAGIQADLKTFSAHHVFGTTAITAVTAQNTLGVQSVEVLSVEIVRAQIEAVLDDFAIRGSKAGMLANAEIIAEVASIATRGYLPRLVVDPVMYSASGHRLLEENALEAYQTRLIPAAYLVTPNVAEAEALVGGVISNVTDLAEAARAICGLGATNALVKGGHLDDPEQSIDILCTPTEMRTLKAQRVQTTNIHGTGCTLSAAITANLARGMGLIVSVQEAKSYVTEAIRSSAAWALGKGSGPLDHFSQVLHHH